MEFDADWIWIAIFGGVMLLRALGSMFGKSRKRVGKELAETPRPSPSPSPTPRFEPGTAAADRYQAEERPTPIEPR